jgi:hypothetical protein
LEDSLPPQGRAAKAVYLLVTYGAMTSSELMQRLGYRKRDGLVYMLKHLAETVPVVYDESNDKWRIEKEEDGDT